MCIDLSYDKLDPQAINVYFSAIVDLYLKKDNCYHPGVTKNICSTGMIFFENTPVFLDDDH